MIKLYLKTILLLTLLLLIISGCEDGSKTGGIIGDSDNTTSNGTDSSLINGSDTDSEYVKSTDHFVDTGVDSAACDSLMEITVRDFDASHPDMERADAGWGPLAGVLEDTLDGDRKPVFSSADGLYTWKTGLEPGVLEKNCWDSGPGTPETCYAGTIPMFEGADSFYDWYHDTANNQRFEKQLQLEDSAEKPGVFVYDTTAFFPLSPTEGFGITPSSNNPSGMNYLFTTEIHFKFIYNAGQKFTFRGDDDLWIFVNNKIALDLGGMHLPFEGTIDFDAVADFLGITPGGLYNMDIFHAERHTTGSNFRIETNISCFIPVSID
ncbi:MAG: fibro-slime domain-containing protein [Deltaproteobacteria bacterium]|nr:fibro-slime domain-containing protein [Deltaproteobacteria bacterium]